MRRSLQLASTLWLAFQTAACDTPTQSTAPEVETPEKSAPAPETATNSKSISVSSLSELRPGEEARITGRNLDHATRATLDGTPVSFRLISATEATIMVPRDRSCEIDGRKAVLEINNTVRHTGTIDVEETLRLEVGESVILKQEQLSCLRFAGEERDYVLLASNFSREASTESLFRLRTYTTNPDTTLGTSNVQYAQLPSPSSSGPHQSIGSSPAPSSELLRSVSSSLSISERTTSSARAFDTRYATAQVGDTLRMVDWSDSRSMSEKNPARVPTYAAVVIAVSETQVILADTREVNAADYLTPEVQERLSRAAQIASRYQEPALKTLMDPSLQLPQGAKGRQFSMLTELPAGVMGQSGGYDLLGEKFSPWTSDIYLTYLTSAVSNPQYSAEQIAGTLIHENAHMTDLLLSLRNGKQPSAGWYSEALAVRATEVAARMAMGREQGAKAVQGGKHQAGVPRSEISVWPSNSSLNYPLWGRADNPYAASPAAYDRGARVLLAADEAMGNAGFQSKGDPLYLRLLKKSHAYGNEPTSALRAWSIEAVAAEVGMAPNDLLEQTSIAELTDDLVGDSPDRISLSSWDLSAVGISDRARFDHLLTGDRAVEAEGRVAGGLANHWFVKTEDGRGLSLKFSDTRLTEQHRLRVMRLR